MNKNQQHISKTLCLAVLVIELVSKTDAAPAPADTKYGLPPSKLQPTHKPPPGGFYTTRYDHIDVENILNQKRLVYHYAECLLDRGPCPPQGLEFKRILPEALRTNCLYCTPKQRYVTYRSIRRLRKEYPEVWAKLSAIWDPSDEYFLQLEQSVINDKSTNIQIPQKKQQFTTTSTSSSSNIQKIPSGALTTSTTRNTPIELIIRTTTPTTTTTYRPSTYPPSILSSTFANLNAILPISNSINSNNIEGQSSEDAIFLADRFGSSSEILPAKPDTTFLNGFSSTTIRSINTSSSFNNDVPNLSSTSQQSTSSNLSTAATLPVYDIPIVITSKPLGNILPTVTTVKRINISIEGRPFSRPPGTIPTPINNLILGTNQILGSLTDIASKVIVTGNNLAGMVLNTVQNVLVG